MASDFTEDLEQERALAALAGEEFKESAVLRRYRPYEEVLTGEREIHTGSAGGNREFTGEAAAHRNEKLRPLLVECLTRGFTAREIAQVLTDNSVPKMRGWARGAWSASGVKRILRNLGINHPMSTATRRRVCGDPGGEARRKQWMHLPAAARVEIMRKVALAAHSP